MIPDFHKSALARELTERGGRTEDVLYALDIYYSNYSRDLLIWLAGLYDHGVGGFYYSNSARDNAWFRPDIESTNQALHLLEGVGVIKNGKELPEEMRSAIAGFVKSLQSEEDGYFYHPQWGKEITDHRRGRDLSWAISLSKNLGFSFNYKTANERLAELSGAKAEEKKCSPMPDHLLSSKAMLRYLDSYDWQGDAYYSGNAIAAQWNEIYSAGLAKTVIGFLNEKQNKETGLWGDKEGYPAINALLKISAFYRNARMPMPNPIPAAEAVMEIMTRDVSCGSVCWQYNTWFSIVNIKEIMSHSGKEGEEESRAISARLLTKAPEAILSSAKKVKSFLKPDGSFSYKQDRTSPTSQGAAVALENTNEGDVNASVICSGGITQNMWRALDLDPWRIPIFESEALDLFLTHLKI